MTYTGNLMAVDEIKISIIMDNTVDFFASESKIVKQLKIQSMDILPIAEHGLSILVQVKSGNKQATILLDAGTSPKGVLHNFNAFGIDLADLEAIILSHGHIDHTAGLPGLIEKLGTQRISLVMHPDACLEKKLILPDGADVKISPPEIKTLGRGNVDFIETNKATLLSYGMLLVSGEIERTTEFEKGLPIHYTKRNDVWEHDPLVKDDQCLIVNLRGQGLIIISGCSHSGIINTIIHAQRLTNCQKIHAVLGGFHLSGGIFEKIIPFTITELQKLKPAYLMPGHCTGWSAIHQIARAMPDEFIPSNVGTQLVFQAC